MTTYKLLILELSCALIFLQITIFIILMKNSLIQNFQKNPSYTCPLYGFTINIFYESCLTSLGKQKWIFYDKQEKIYDNINDRSFFINQSAKIKVACYQLHIQTANVQIFVNVLKQI